MYQGKQKQRMGLPISKKMTISISLAVIYIISSLYIYPLCIVGDQFFYRIFYEDVQSLDFGDAFLSYRSTLGAFEPVYFLLVKTFSGVIEKDVLMSLANGALVFYLARWLSRNKVSWFVIPLFAINFYLLVLLFSAERLKISMLLLLISLEHQGIKKGILAALSFLSHTQAALLIVNWLSLKVAPIINGVLHGKFNKKSFAVLGLVALCMAVAVPMSEYMTEKVGAYSEKSSGPSELIKPLLFVALTLFYAKRDRLNAIILHSPLLFGAFLIGANRIVIFSYFIFLAYALKHKKGRNIGVIVTSLYFSYQGFNYLSNLFEHGDGFYGL